MSLQGRKSKPYLKVKDLVFDLGPHSILLEVSRDLLLAQEELGFGLPGLGFGI